MWMMIHENLFTSTNQDTAISFMWENSKIFKISVKYFSIFYNKPPASCVAHITRDFLTSYSCLYYSSVISLGLSIGLTSPFINSMKKETL